MQETKIAELLIEELKRANHTYGTRFASPHEGYAVMLEELDELFEEIRQKRPNKERLREETIQIGAMAIKFIMSLEDWARADKRSETYCKKCRFHVISLVDLEELGSDPCETCDTDLGNWELDTMAKKIIRLKLYLKGRA